MKNRIGAWLLLLWLANTATITTKAFTPSTTRIVVARHQTKVGVVVRRIPHDPILSSCSATRKAAAAASDADAAPAATRQRRPSFLKPLYVLLQVATLAALYAFHLTVLTQHVAIIGGYIPIGYDSLAGAAVAVWYFVIYGRRTKRTSKTAAAMFPWKLPASTIMVAPTSITTTTTESESQSNEASNNSSDASMLTTWKAWLRSADWRWIRFRVSTAVTVAALINAYFQTGKFSLFWEDLLFSLSAAGWPLTIPLSRSLQVLMGHLSWVAAGSTLLWAIPRPPPFFASPPRQQKTALSDDDLDNGYYRWFRISSKNWLWWTIGGYFVSSWLFNVADAANRYILPAQVLQEAAESVVAQLVQPEHNDIWASVIGYIAPCVSAPVWEELLYRGFLLAGLTASTGGAWHASCLLQAVLFSAHHMSVTAALPLFVLGWTWAVLYTHSRNLLSVILVHAMWNSRVFIGSWFGL